MCHLRTCRYSATEQPYTRIYHNKIQYLHISQDDTILVYITTRYNTCIYITRWYNTRIGLYHKIIQWSYMSQQDTMLAYITRWYNTRISQQDTILAYIVTIMNINVTDASTLNKPDLNITLYYTIFNQSSITSAMQCDLRMMVDPYNSRS